MSGVVVAARVLFDALQSFEPALLSGEDCAAVVAELARVEKACGTARARAAARAVACGSHTGGGAGAPREWLARLTGSSSGQAQAELDTAVLAERCPATRDAMVRGDISLMAAGEITKTAWQVPGSEAELLATALREPFHVLKDTARRRRLENIEPGELHRRQREAKRFRHWRDELGMIRVDAALTPEIGVPLVNRLEAEVDRLWRKTPPEQRSEPRERLAADAFAVIVEGGGKGRNRQADLTVVVDSRKLLHGDTADGPCQIIGGGPIPVAVAREVAADAFVKIVLHDGVNIQKVAHVGRYQPAELRTALLLGRVPDFDGITCVEPGCGRQAGLEWDHDDPVANGGLTTIDNENPHCKPHHWEKTERDRKNGLLNPRRDEQPEPPP